MGPVTAAGMQVCTVGNIRGIVVWNLIAIHCRAENAMRDSLVEQGRPFGPLPSHDAAASGAAMHFTLPVAQTAFPPVPHD